MNPDQWREIEEVDGHKWGYWKKDTFKCCQICGMIRRADKKNKPCKGPAKLRKLFPPYN